jgi:hypothetical protein
MRTIAIAALLSLGPACVGEMASDDTPGPTPGADAGSAADAGSGRPDAAEEVTDGGPDGTDAGSVGLDSGEPPGTDGGAPAAGELEEVGGLVSFEAESYDEQVNTETIATEWYTFRAGAADPTVSCVTNLECNSSNQPHCNEYPSCDGDAIDPDEAAGDAYVEALPDRRRDDSEAGTGNLGVVNDPTRAPTLRYRVHFTTTGRYYVWGRSRGQGPAANGLHIGLDGTWPRNDLVDPSSMRMQFPSGWGWTQNRRGGTQHTGVAATGDVSRRDANIWLEIDTPGPHVIELAMREDGLELDKIVMTLDPDFTPTADGPPETRR